MSASGSVRWPPEAPVWTFTWEVIDGNSEAIAFRDVYYRGIKVLHKASLPMIRVQYDSGNGPYKDRLSSGNIQGPVKVYEGTNPSYRFSTPIRQGDPNTRRKHSCLSEANRVADAETVRN